MSDRSGGSGDEVGATSVLHPQPLAGPSDPASLPPGGVVLSASSTTTTTPSSSGGGPAVPGTKQKRPKRKQVKRACSNCRKSHSGCDDLRPCSRCIDNGLESSCADVPRKKRATRRKLPGDPSEFPGGDASAMADMLCPDGRGRVGKVAMTRGGASNNNAIANSSSNSSTVANQDIDDVAKLINMNVLAGAHHHHQMPHHAHQLPYSHHPQQQHPHAPPAVSSHPLCLKAEPSTADHGLASSSSSAASAYMPAPTPLASSSGSSSLFAGPSRASELAAGMNKANNYQSLVTELSDLRRYNTRLEHTLQNILVEVQQLRSRSEGSATNGGVVRVKTEQQQQPQPQTQPAGPPLLDQPPPQLPSHQQILHAAPPTHLQQHVQHVMQQQQMVGEAVHFQAAYGGGGNEVPGIATWRVHDSTLLECNDRFMEIVQQPLDTLKNNFKCLQLFPQRLYDEFIGYKQAVLYGDGSGNPSKDSFFLLPDGREKPVVMTLQALKHEDNMSPQFMVMHVVEVLPIAVPQATTPPGGEAADFLQRESGHVDSMAPPLRSATVTSITEVDPSTLHAAPAAASAVPTSSTSSLSTSLPPSAILPPQAAPGEVQPQLQGQQHQLAPSL